MQLLIITTGSIIFAMTSIVIAIVIIYFINKAIDENGRLHEEKNRKEAEERKRLSDEWDRHVNSLKENYYTALLGTDKKAALNAGRAYYGAIRENGQLTIYDEQAITNDLMTME